MPLLSRSELFYQFGDFYVLFCEPSITMETYYSLKTDLLTIRDVDVILYLNTMYLLTIIV